MHLNTMFGLVFGLTATALAIVGIYLTYKYRERMYILLGRL
jgi:hypothetical protein